jgi:hypothetical protein
MSLQNTQPASHAAPLDMTKGDARLTREAAIAHPTFIARVMALWDEGLDTCEIAWRLSEHEHVIACCVRIGRERRRGASPDFAATQE